MPISIDFEELVRKCGIDEVSLLTDDKLQILAPNSRTQKAIIAGFMKRYSKHEIAYSPNVMSFKQWRDSLWRALSFEQALPRLIGNLELKFWLKEEISKDSNWQLTNELGVAEKLLDTYKNLCNWDLSLEDIDQPDTPEQAYFVLWMRKLEAFLADNNFVTDFQLIQLIIESAERLKNELPSKIVLVGFNELTPTEQKLLAYMESLGVTKSIFYPTRKNQTTHRIICQDESQEIEFAVAQAKQWIEDEPQVSIGVVVHQLSAKVENVHRFFSDYFQPEESLPWQPLQKCRYNVSAGLPINDVAEIVAALKILQLKGSGISPEELRFLKNSPFIDWQENNGRVKQLLHQLEINSLAKYSIHYMLSSLQGSEFYTELELLEQRLNRLLNQSFAAKPLKVWADIWRKELENWGWCTKEEKSQNFAVLEFNKILNTIDKFAISARKFNQTQALEFLTQVLRQSSFQLPSDRTDIHVLGVLEAIGLEFDRLILVGFNRENWPQKAKISPFLPLELQRQHSMPGSSAEREYDYALDASKSLLGAANQIVITEMEGEEQSLASVFFEEYPLKDTQVADLIKPQLQLDSDYVWQRDERIDVASGSIRGGAYLLSHYAACPFKALSRHLFKIESSDDAKEGVDARDRGTWLHNAMEIIWNELGSQDNLLKLEREERLALVRNAVSESHERLKSNLYANAVPEIVQIEFDKLISQIEEWLEIDCQKAPFSVATEVDKKLQLNDLEFSFKVDRIDSFEDGRTEIIDYKTGTVDIKKWLGARPEEAQMPAYVIACQDEAASKATNFDLDALAYAKIKTGEIARTGISFKEKTAPEAFENTAYNKYRKLKTNLNAASSDVSLFQDWRLNLNQLATSIEQGNMPVSPKISSKVCQFCEYSGFCRIKESQPEDTTENATTNDGVNNE